MKSCKLTVIFALCLTLSTTQIALGDFSSIERAERFYSGTAALESLIPRDGLKFYFELRSSGLAQLAGSRSALEQIKPIFEQPGKPIATGEYAGFLTRNLSALQGARMAVASYGLGGTALLFEAASPNDAERLRPELARLFGLSARSQAETETGMEISLRGRVAMVGDRHVITRLTEADYSLTLIEDPTFLKARSRFQNESFFVYMKSGGLPVPIANGPAQGVPYLSMLGSLSGLPQSVAIGGNLQGDQLTMRALVFSNPNSKDLFTAIFSVTGASQMAGASFASADADMFVGLMLDWNKLYDSVQSLFEMFLGGAAASQSAPAPARRSGDDPTEYTYRYREAQKLGLLSPTEASMGLSIKNDLLPTLGSEVGITIAGLSDIFPAHAARSSKPSAPRMLLLLSLRNPLQFEKLLGQILNPKGRPSQPLAQTAYRGATIKYRKGFAYTITSGYFIAGVGLDAVKHSLDARYSNLSLASAAQYRSVMGASRQTVMQMYVSGKMAGLMNQFAAAAISQGAAMADLQMKTPLGMVMLPDDDGLMIEMRASAALALTGLSSMARGASSDMNSLPSGVPGGVPGGVSGGRRAPTLTNDDIRKP